MLTRNFVILGVTALASCSMSQSTVATTEASTLDEEIKYVSTDLRHVAVFSKDGARFGPDLAMSGEIWPSSPAKYFITEDQVQCVSIGPQNNTVEFAIKRPIRQGEIYRCLRTTFRVKECFGECRAAVIEVESIIGGKENRGTLKSQLYVDDCMGVLVFSQNGDLSHGIPLNAEWLRGRVGILADHKFPACD